MTSYQVKGAANTDEGNLVALISLKDITYQERTGRICSQPWGSQNGFLESSNSIKIIPRYKSFSEVVGSAELAGPATDYIHCL
jgi:hypothetical protein